jgi:hypothetical protein
LQERILTHISSTGTKFRKDITKYADGRLNLHSSIAFGLINLNLTSFHFKFAGYEVCIYSLPTYNPPHAPVTVAKFALWKSVMLRTGSDSAEDIRDHITRLLFDRDESVVALLLQSFRTTGRLPDIKESDLTLLQQPGGATYYIEGRMITLPLGRKYKQKFGGNLCRHDIFPG